MQGPRARPATVDQAIRNRILTPGEAVVAAINSPVITAPASSSPPSASTPVTGTVASIAAVAGPSPSSSPASASSASAIPANIPPNPTLVPAALPPSATRTQAPRAASAFARQQHHRLTAIPHIHPPPAPIDQDHDMEDVNNSDNSFDNLMQDEFDQPGLEELPPQRTYEFYAPSSPSPPPAIATSTSSSAASSSASIHTYSTRPHTLGPQPQHLAQTAQSGQAGGGDDGDFKLINVKINGLVVPIMFDVKSLREAIFS
ncbi:hypothetical protein BGX30_014334 [Mortierella sp. GBA39]|nr:hypothetical protein BGX30_014334 [Mortierella sp. GBA39]